MRQKIVMAFCCFISVSFLHAQSGKSEMDTTIFNLQIPKKWNDAKFIYQLTGLIEKHIPLLKDKKVCLGCSNTPNTVSLFLTQPKIVTQTITNATKAYETKSEKYEYAIYFYFMASLRFTEKSENALHENQEIVLIDSLENQSKVKIFDAYSGRNPNTNSTDQATTTTNVPSSNVYYSSAPTYYLPTPSSSPTINNSSGNLFDTEKFKQEHEKAMKPDDNEIRHIVESRVLLLQSTIKK